MLSDREATVSKFGLVAEFLSFQMLKVDDCANEESTGDKSSASEMTAVCRVGDPGSGFETARHSHAGQLSEQLNVADDGTLMMDDGVP